MRLRLRVPRPEHQEAKPDEQEAWKKKLTTVVEQVQKEHPDADVEVWCEDEHRIGLQPVNRRSWVEEGSQPVAIVNWKREWLWLYDESATPNGGDLLVDSEAESPDRVLCPANPRPYVNTLVVQSRAEG